jgi:site-specific DNA-adenine methylase
MANTYEQKKQYVKEYIRSLKAIEDAMEPYKEQRRELRSEFKENGWLNTDEIRAAVKAYRLHTGTIEIDSILDNLDIISGEKNED